jgi:DNA-binding transcriptional MerR regulator
MRLLTRSPGSWFPSDFVAERLDSETFYCHDWSMTEPQSYTIGDLARRADVTPRTVRYYVAQGLLPSPQTLGPASRYGESHLARLQLIRRLQRRHLPLAEIRRQLEALSDAEVRAALAAAEPSPPAAEVPGSALDYVREVLRPAPDPRSRRIGPPRRPMRALAQLTTPLLPERRLPVGHTPRMAPPPPMTLGVSESQPARPAEPVPDRSQWERLTLTPDIELHIRRPLSRTANRQVERLVALARTLLEEDPS